MPRGTAKPLCAPGELPPPGIWERLERLEAAPNPPRTTLKHDQIAGTAVALADAEGLDAVSMRRLADQLGVATMALYRYVANKDELIELMINAAYEFGEAPPLAPGDWRTAVARLAHGTRTRTLDHPWLVEAQALVPNLLTPARNRAMDWMLGGFEGLAVDGDTRMMIMRVVDAFARGAVVAEVNQRRMLERRGLGPDGDMRQLLTADMVWMLRSGRYPRFTETVRGGLSPVDAAAEFEVGLAALLDGLGARFGI
jgi:AcrR family transcriptional regulator